MLYTQEEKNKIHENLDKIKEYLETLQPKIRDRITVDFGAIKTYAYGDREREFHIFVEKDNIFGRTGGLCLEYTKEPIRSSTTASVYNWLEYAVALIQNWQFIKREILSKIAEQNETISAISNFEI